MYDDDDMLEEIRLRRQEELELREAQEEERRRHCRWLWEEAQAEREEADREIAAQARAEREAWEAEILAEERRAQEERAEREIQQRLERAAVMAENTRRAREEDLKRHSLGVARAVLTDPHYNLS